MLKKIFVAIILILIIIGIFHTKTDVEKYTLNINNKDIILDVSSTEEARNKGLGGKDSLELNKAMLFIFEKPDKYAFWMKDMKFPLDMVWLDQNKKIVYIANKIVPETYPKNFIPPENSLYVIEFNAGFVDENHLSVGNILDFVKTQQK